MLRKYSSVVGVALLLGGCDSESSEEELPVTSGERTTAALKQFSSCEDLHARLKKNLSDEMEIQLLQFLDARYFGPDGGRVDDVRGIGVAEFDSVASADESGGNTGAREEGVDFSGTNNQETGVDEADFVKTDGFHIYVLNGNRLEVFGTPQFGDLIPEGGTEVEGVPSSMLMGESRIAVISTLYPWAVPQEHQLHKFLVEPDGDFAYHDILTKVTVFNRSDLSLVRELYIQGRHQAARRVNTSVRLVSYTYRNIQGLQDWADFPDSYWRTDSESLRRAMAEEAVSRTISANRAVIEATQLTDFVPQVFERRPDGTIITHAATDSGCTNFSIADDGFGRGLTSILSFDLVDVEQRFETDHLVTNRSQVYASADTLLVAEPAQDWWWFWDHQSVEEATNIHRFDISGAGTTRYTGSGRVPGVIQDQFSLSEHEGDVRVASTVGRWNRWWLPVDEQTGPLNYVFVLQGTEELSVVGQTPGLAEGEQIWSSRFVGDKAYLVTFRNVDPLFTIDLSDPTAPAVIGELKIAGVSTYIHPLADTQHLLTIGIAGDDEGLFWGQTQLSLFDVSDFANPTLDSAMRLVPEAGETGWSYGWSEAQWEHKAFQYWAPKKLLGVPLSAHQSTWDREVGERYVYSSRLELIEVDDENGELRNYGSIDHSEFFNRDARWWDYRDVRRSIFMGDYIYALSDRGITAHQVDTLEKVASAPLDGQDFEYYWWW